MSLDARHLQYLQQHLQKLKSRTMAKVTEEDATNYLRERKGRDKKIRLLQNDVAYAEGVASRRPVPKEISIMPTRSYTRAGAILTLCQGVVIVLALAGLCAWYGWKDSYAKAYPQGVSLGEANGARLSVSDPKRWNDFVRNVTKK